MGAFTKVQQQEQPSLDNIGGHSSSSPDLPGKTPCSVSQCRAKRASLLPQTPLVFDYVFCLAHLMTSTATVSFLISMANASSVIFFAAAAPALSMATEMLCSDDAFATGRGWDRKKYKKRERPQRGWVEKGEEDELNPR